MMTSPPLWKRLGGRWDLTGSPVVSWWRGSLLMTLGSGRLLPLGRW